MECHLCTCLGDLPSFIDFPSLIAHLKETHASSTIDMFVCPLCPATHRGEEALQCHLINKHNSFAPYNMREEYMGLACGDCGLYLSLPAEGGEEEWTAFASQMANHSPENMRPLFVHSSTPITEDLTVAIRMYRVDEVRRKGGRKEQCPHCKENFGSRPKLKKHLLRGQQECKSNLPTTGLALLVKDVIEEEKKIPKDEDEQAILELDQSSTVPKLLARLRSNDKDDEAKKPSRIVEKVDVKYKDSKVSVSIPVHRRSVDTTIAYTPNGVLYTLHSCSKCNILLFNMMAMVDHQCGNRELHKHFTSKPDSDARIPCRVKGCAHRACSVLGLQVHLSHAHNVDYVIEKDMDKYPAHNLQKRAARPIMVQELSSTKVHTPVKRTPVNATSKKARRVRWEDDEPSSSVSPSGNKENIANGDSGSPNSQEDITDSVESRDELTTPSSMDENTQSSSSLASIAGADDERMEEDSETATSANEEETTEILNYVAMESDDEQPRPSVAQNGDGQDNGDPHEDHGEEQLRPSTSAMGLLQCYLSEPRSSYTPKRDFFRLCRLCMTVMPSDGEAYAAHMRRHTKKERRLKSCPNCSMMVSKREWAAHQRDHLKVQLRCIPCLRSFIDDTRYYLHLVQDHAVDLVHYCARCNLATKCLERMKEHITSKICLDVALPYASNTRQLAGVIGECLFTFEGSFVPGGDFTVRLPKYYQHPRPRCPILPDCGSRSMIYKATTDSAPPFTEHWRISCPTDLFPIPYARYLEHESNDENSQWQQPKLFRMSARAFKDFDAQYEEVRNFRFGIRGIPELAKYWPVDLSSAILPATSTRPESAEATVESAPVQPTAASSVEIVPQEVTSTASPTAASKSAAPALAASSAIDAVAAVPAAQLPVVATPDNSLEEAAAAAATPVLASLLRAPEPQTATVPVASATSPVKLIVAPPVVVTTAAPIPASVATASATAHAASPQTTQTAPNLRVASRASPAIPVASATEATAAPHPTPAADLSLSRKRPASPAPAVPSPKLAKPAVPSEDRSRVEEMVGVDIKMMRLYTDNFCKRGSEIPYSVEQKRSTRLFTKIPDFVQPTKCLFCNSNRGVYAPLVDRRDDWIHSFIKSSGASTQFAQRMFDMCKKKINSRVCARHFELSEIDENKDCLIGDAMPKCLMRTCLICEKQIKAGGTEMPIMYQNQFHALSTVPDTKKTPNEMHEECKKDIQYACSICVILATEQCPDSLPEAVRAQIEAILIRDQCSSAPVSRSPSTTSTPDKSRRASSSTSINSAEASASSTAPLVKRSLSTTASPVKSSKASSSNSTLSAEASLLHDLNTAFASAHFEPPTPAAPPRAESPEDAPFEPPPTPGSSLEYARLVLEAPADLQPPPTPGMQQRVGEIARELMSEAPGPTRAAMPPPAAPPVEQLQQRAAPQTVAQQQQRPTAPPVIQQQRTEAQRVVTVADAVAAMASAQSQMKQPVTHSIQHAPLPPAAAMPRQGQQQQNPAAAAPRVQQVPPMQQQRPRPQPAAAAEAVMPGQVRQQLHQQQQSRPQMMPLDEVMNRLKHVPPAIRGQVEAYHATLVDGLRNLGWDIAIVKDSLDNAIKTALEHPLTLQLQQQQQQELMLRQQQQQQAQIAQMQQQQHQQRLQQMKMRQAQQPGPALPQQQQQRPMAQPIRQQTQAGPANGRPIIVQQVLLMSNQQMPQPQPGPSRPMQQQQAFPQAHQSQQQQQHPVGLLPGPIAMTEEQMRTYLVQHNRGQMEPAQYLAQLYMLNQSALFDEFRKCLERQRLPGRPSAAPAARAAAQVAQPAVPVPPPAALVATQASQKWLPFKFKDGFFNCGLCAQQREKGTMAARPLVENVEELISSLGVKKGTLSWRALLNLWEDAPLEALICGEHVTSTDQLGEHCGDCGQRYFPPEVSFHKYHHKKEWRFCCRDCPMPLDGSEQRAVMHMKNRHKIVFPAEVRFVCPLKGDRRSECDHKCSSVDDYRQHLERHHGAFLRNVCPEDNYNHVCGLRFRTQEAMLLHMEQVESEKKRLGRQDNDLACCPLCGTVDLWEGEIDGEKIHHFMMHSLDWTTMCRYDFMEMRRGMEAREHFLDHHWDDAAVQCKACTFKPEGQLRSNEHADTHLLIGVSKARGGQVSNDNARALLGL